MQPAHARTYPNNTLLLLSFSLGSHHWNPNYAADHLTPIPHLSPPPLSQPPPTTVQMVQMLAIKKPGGGRGM
ncbi:hypothetical protein K440DRAFT_128155 [Wilcoxina mikolae CBS 423.85]|nr:hypothetical protein K440DRAFT_128155 [Wilcoxina mikolae CBS 423.85]